MWETEIEIDLFTTRTYENGTKNQRGIFLKIWKSSRNCAKPRIVGFFERVSHSKF